MVPPNNSNWPLNWYPPNKQPFGFINPGLTLWCLYMFVMFGIYHFFCFTTWQFVILMGSHHRWEMLFMNRVQTWSAKWLFSCVYGSKWSFLWVIGTLILSHSHVSSGAHIPWFRLVWSCFLQFLGRWTAFRIPIFIWINPHSKSHDFYQLFIIFRWFSAGYSPFSSDSSNFPMIFLWFSHFPMVFLWFFL